jgi:hypothetical protein
VTLDDVLKSLPEDQEEAFRAALTSFEQNSSHHTRIGRALFVDPRPDERSWAELIEAVLRRGNDKVAVGKLFLEFWSGRQVPFQEVLASYADHKRRKVEDHLHHFAVTCSICHQMVQNLYAEQELHCRDWISLIRKLVKIPANSGSRDNKAVEAAIRGFCRENRILGGCVSDLSPATLYGRVVLMEDFRDLMVKLGYHSTKEVAEKDLLAHLGVPPEDLPRTWRERELGLFLMWGTFDPDGGPPLGKPTPPADHVVCQLGLPPAQGKGLPLTFQYCLPAGIEPRKPTICDAYAGEFWPLYFRPNPLRVTYGQTMPTDTCPEKLGKPEVVHKVVKAETLRAPIRFLRGPTGTT